MFRKTGRDSTGTELDLHQPYDDFPRNGTIDLQGLFLKIDLTVHHRLQAITCRHIAQRYIVLAVGNRQECGSVSIRRSSRGRSGRVPRLECYRRNTRRRPIAFDNDMSDNGETAWI